MPSFFSVSLSLSDSYCMHIHARSSAQYMVSWNLNPHKIHSRFKCDLHFSCEIYFILIPSHISTLSMAERAIKWQRAQPFVTPRWLQNILCSDDSGALHACQNRGLGLKVLGLKMLYFAL